MKRENTTRCTFCVKGLLQKMAGWMEGGAKDWAAPVDLPKADAHNTKHVTLFCSSQIITRKSHNMIGTWTVSIHLITSALLPLDCWVTLIYDTLTATMTPADNSSSRFICWESSRAILTLCSAGGRHSNKIYFSLVWLRLSELSPAGLFRGWGGSITFAGLCWLLAWNVCRHVLGCCLGSLLFDGDSLHVHGKWGIWMLLGPLCYSKNISGEEQTIFDCWVSLASLTLQTD